MRKRIRIYTMPDPQIPMFLHLYTHPRNVYPLLENCVAVQLPGGGVDTYRNSSKSYLLYPNNVHPEHFIEIIHSFFELS